jgi:hypothetical protein
MRTSKELQIGKAGEYIVCADLILKGFVAFPSEQGLPYDVILDVGHRIFRVQVKTTLSPRIVPQRSTTECKAYIFSIKRAGKNGLLRYTDKDIDLYALVCLDTRQVGYLKGEDMPTTINIRCDSLKGTHYDEKGILDFQKVLELSKTLSQKQISEQTGLHISAISRMLKEGYLPYETKARYFSHFERQAEWFTSL